MVVGFKLSSERGGEWLRPVRTIGSTAQTAYPQRNILDVASPLKPARTSAAASTSTYFGVDFGAAVSIDAVLVGGLSVASIKIQANTADSWGTPTRDSGALTVAQDDVTGRYNYFYEPSGWTSGTRYVRVVSNTSSTVDSSGTFGVGYLLVLGTVTELVTPLADPVDLTPAEAVLSGEAIGGADDTIAVGNRRAIVSIAQSASSASNDSEILDFLRVNGQAGRFVWYMNDGDRSQAYVMRRRGQNSLTLAGPNLRRVGAITLVEVCD